VGSAFPMSDFKIYPAGTLYAYVSQSPFSGVSLSNAKQCLQE